MSYLDWGKYCRQHIKKHDEHAIHEGGHVVVGIYFGFPVIRVSVREMDGRVGWTELAANFESECNRDLAKLKASSESLVTSSGKLPPLAEAWLSYYMGGELAQRCFNITITPDQIEVDRKYAHKMLSFCNLKEDEVVEHGNRIRGETINLMSGVDICRAVDEVARLVVRSDEATLYEEEINAIPEIIAIQSKGKTW